MKAHLPRVSKSKKSHRKIGFLRIRAVLAVISVALFGVPGCHRAQNQDPRPVTVPPGVTTQDVRFFSKALQRDMPYRVFLPATVSRGQKLPVVFLLHGGGADFQDWSTHSAVASYAARGIILVMPEGFSSYYMNAALRPQDRFEDYLLHDLLSDVEARFPVASARDERAVIGISMGGFAAIRVALTHPEIFGFVGAISPAIDVPSRTFNYRRLSQSWHFRTIFGPAGSEARKASDPFLLIRTADPSATPYILITAGKQEPLLEPIERFVSRLKERHFSYEFQAKDGGHSWNQWNEQIPGCFAALFKHLAQ